MIYSLLNWPSSIIINLESRKIHRVYYIEWLKLYYQVNILHTNPKKYTSKTLMVWQKHIKSKLEFLSFYIGVTCDIYSGMVYSFIYMQGYYKILH